MKKIIFGAILFFMAINLNAQKHHDGKKFRNPYPGFEKRGATDVFQWAVIDRFKGKRPKRPDSYHFATVNNNGREIRTNKKDFSVTWVGHSTLLIQVDGLNILTDPIWSERASPVQLAGPKRYVEPALKFEDLPEIDVVIISHDHYDHLDRNTIQQLGNKPLYFVPLGIGEILLKWGIKNFVELDWWDSNKFNGIRFTCLPAQHFSGRNPLEENETLWASWLIEGREKKFYFGGDSGYFPGYAEIGAKFGPIDFAALPIGAFRPVWFMGPVHMSPRQAVKALQDLNANTFIPIHWGTFDLADDLLDEPPRLLRNEIKDSELKEDRFWILQHGETRILKNTEQSGHDAQVNK